MWSHLKKLISDRVGKRPTRRRKEATHFRGQFESLEQRTVLSATVGVAAIDIVAINFDANSITVIAIWESRPPAMDRPALAAAGPFGDAPWENLPARSLFGDHRQGYGSNAGLDRPPVYLLGGGVGTGGSTTYVADPPTSFSESLPKDPGGQRDPNQPLAATVGASPNTSWRRLVHVWSKCAAQDWPPRINRFRQLLFTTGHARHFRVVELCRY